MIRGYQHLIGTRIGSLQIQSSVIKNKRTFLNCKCDCGTTKLMAGYHVKSGNCNSCGCKSAKTTGKQNPTYTGYEDISGTLWNHIIDGAKTRNLELTIDIKYAWNIFLKQNRKCALSGIELKFNKNFSVRDGNASLDRIDSSKGYICGNVQWIAKTLNRMKGKLTDEEFIKWCHLVANHNPTIKAEVAV